MFKGSGVELSSRWHHGFEKTTPVLPSNATDLEADCTWCPGCVKEYCCSTETSGRVEIGAASTPVVGENLTTHKYASAQRKYLEIKNRTEFPLLMHYP
ncbi:hypothetical protein AV530_013666 [Patagioenas fasciata monilis]|uniref:Uncharacterized protein n=1 Tax=Patagioenas fasciata monilis TaxID=372326 RepID=A0A1V4J8P0_PATFA|nr:hypothetical protein AV530_013666 [Patagioenas fasciata monilis]